MQDILKRISSPGNRCSLLLDDSVGVVQSLVHTTQDQEYPSSMAKQDVENFVNQRVQKALLSLNSRNNPRTSKSGHFGRFDRHKRSNNDFKKDGGQKGGSSSKVSKSRKSHKRRIHDLVPENSCFDCGETSHAQGSNECRKPIFLPKKIQSSTREKTSSVREVSAQKKSFGESSEERNRSGNFRPGSSRGPLN